MLRLRVDRKTISRPEVRFDPLSVAMCLEELVITGRHQRSEAKEGSGSLIMVHSWLIKMTASPRPHAFKLWRITLLYLCSLRIAFVQEPLISHIQATYFHLPGE